MRTLFAAMLLFQFSGVQSAQADTPIFLSNSAEDRKQPANMNYRYEVIGMSVTVMKENTGVIIFKVLLGSSVSNTSFMPYGNAYPVLQVKVLNQLTNFKDQNGDLWLQAPSEVPYQAGTPIDAIASVYSDPKVGASSGRKDITALCKPKTWMDSGATSNWVAFSIDRNCADIPDLFWATTFIDSDKYASSYVYDSKYAPADPMYVDMRNVPRPPKKVDQKVVFTATPSTTTLEFPNTSISATSSAGLPVIFSSQTPAICQVSSANGNQASLSLVSTGTCRIDAWSDGTATVNPSTHIQYSFTINPIVKVSQNFQFYGPYYATEGDPDFEVNITASSGLPVTLQSSNASVCYFKDPVNKPRLLSVLGPGTCLITITQAGSIKYYGATATAKIEISEKYVAPAPEATSSPTSKPNPTPSPKQTFGGTGTSAKGSTSVNTATKSDSLNQKLTKTTTIDCKNVAFPSKVKKVTAVKPKCPTGYVKK